MLLLGWNPPFLLPVLFSRSGVELLPAGPARDAGRILSAPATGTAAEVALDTLVRVDCLARRGVQIPLEVRIHGPVPDRHSRESTTDGRSKRTTTNTTHSCLLILDKNSAYQSNLSDTRGWRTQSSALPPY